MFKNDNQQILAFSLVFFLNLVSLVLSPQEVAAVDGLYRIRVPRVFLQADRQTEWQMEGHLTAFVRAVRTSLLFIRISCFSS